MTYQYEPERRRLQHLTAVTAKNRSIMNNTYGYDAVDNIMSLTNAAATANSNQQGGPASYTYQYDDLYRLVSSAGRFQNGSGHVHTYDFGMEYSASGNILKKNQSHKVNNNVQGKTSYIFAYAYESDKPHAASAIGDSRYTYDLNGNPTLIAETSRNQERRMAWDEENRLLALADNGKSYHYMYDAAGERVLKGKGDGQFVSVNGFNPAGVGFTGNYSMYVNSFLVVNGSRYTKHFYIESQRIASKISERSIDKEISEPKVGGNGGVDYEKKHKLSKEALYAAYIAAGMQPEIPTAGKSGKIPYGQLKKYFETSGNNGNNGNNGSVAKFENLQFYYHPDHLGSSNYITDASGEVYQHNEYFPYGETFVEERNGSEYTTYLFSGKELDVETGLYYFGARYQDPRTSVFLNIDPKVDKYPGISPYAYCFNNPIRFIDPNGEGPFDEILGNLNLGKMVSNVVQHVVTQTAKAVVNGVKEYLNEHVTVTPYLEVDASITAGATYALKGYAAGVDVSPMTAEMVSANFEWNKEGADLETNWVGKDGELNIESTVGLGVPIVPLVGVDASGSMTNTFKSGEGYVGSSTTYNGGTGVPSVAGIGVEYTQSTYKSSKSSTMKSGIFASWSYGLGWKVNISGSIGIKIETNNGE